jgi:hypothetical protein
VSNSLHPFGSYHRHFTGSKKIMAKFDPNNRKKLGDPTAPDFGKVSNNSSSQMENTLDPNKIKDTSHHSSMEIDGRGSNHL